MTDDGWIDIRELVSGLPASPVWTLHSGTEAPLVALLSTRGFRIHSLEGTTIISEEAFFREAARCFDFPAYAGLNWDAFNECLGEFLDEGPSRVAVIWRDSQQSAARSLPTFVAAVHMLLNASQAVRDEKLAVAQLAVFLVGDGEGFVRASMQ